MATWDRYTGTVTSLEVDSLIGAPFYIRSFCDDPTGGIYVAKSPVCKLILDPTTQFVNTNISWDISNSRSATGTIDTFDITWGGTTNIGNLAAQDWSVDPKSGNVQYTTAGTYNATAYVTDTLGKRSKQCETQVTILPSDDGELGAADRVYIGTTDGGLYILTTTTLTQSNTGLTGNHTNFRSMRLHPEYRDLDSDQRHLWAATADGVAYSTDGGANWSVISKATLGTPENAAGDVTPPVTGDLDQIDLWFDPQDQDRVYLLRTTATRSWLYYTDDYGASWSNEQVGVM